MMTLGQLAKMGRELTRFLALFAGCFRSQPGLALVRIYVQGLLSDLGRKNAEAIEKFDAAKAWPVAEYLNEVKRLIWQTPQGTAPDANRRALQRAYVGRVTAIVNPPAPPPAAAAAAAPGPAAPPGPFLAPVNLAQSDLPALARAQLRAIQAAAKAAASTATTAVLKAHWSDIADRVGEALEPRR